MTSNPDNLVSPDGAAREAPTRNFAVSGQSTGIRAWLADGLASRFAAHGYDILDEPVDDVDFVLHMFDRARPRSYRRKSAPTFVLAVAETDEVPDNVLAEGYPVIVRALANLTVLVGESADGRFLRFVTLEQGTYGIGPGVSDDELFAEAYRRIEPLASSRLVIANEFVHDLPPELHDGDDRTRAVKRAGERLDDLNLLPAPVELEELLSERERRHIKLLYGIGGLSYGNVSTRRLHADGEPTDEFWMSASGVDKSTLDEVGTDILLVRDYNPDTASMVLSVPRGITPNRVSVDAIEHWMIYREHPDVGAILHVHGWIDGIEATDMNYPCGTAELGSAVADLVRRAPDPSRAVVGQKNHGMTITGHDLDEIFERVGAKITANVPME